MGDHAMLCKPIPGSRDWTLVFTRYGKYFFFNSHTSVRSWLPPDELLLKHLTLRLTEAQRTVLFDPFTEEEVFIEDDCEDSDKSEGGDESESDEPLQQAVNPEAPKVSIAHTEEEFKSLLLSRPDLDPFAPWPSITASLSQCPEFTAIASDRRRQALFAEVCPLLVDRKRAATLAAKTEAEAWFKEQLESAKSGHMSWWDFSKRLKATDKGRRHCAQLDLKACEKAFRAPGK